MDLKGFDMQKYIVRTMGHLMCQSTKGIDPLDYFRLYTFGCMPVQHIYSLHLLLSGRQRFSHIWVFFLHAQGHRYICNISKNLQSHCTQV